MRIKLENYSKAFSRRWTHMGAQQMAAIFFFFFAALGFRCSQRASHCSGFSCCAAQTLGTQALVGAHGLSSCSMWALEHSSFSNFGAWAQ